MGTLDHTIEHVDILYKHWIYFACIVADYKHSVTSGLFKFVKAQLSETEQYRFHQVKLFCNNCVNEMHSIFVFYNLIQVQYCFVVICLFVSCIFLSFFILLFSSCTQRYFALGALQMSFYFYFPKFRLKFVCTKYKLVLLTLFLRYRLKSEAFMSMQEE